MTHPGPPPRSLLSPTSSSGWLALVLATLLSAPLAGQTVQGTVLATDDDAPIPGVELALADEGGTVRAATISDTTGWFSLDAPEAGSYTLRASRLGLRAVELELRLAGGERVTVEVRLGPDPIEVEPVQVVGRRQRPARLRAFDDRVEESRRLGRGHVFTRADIERMQPVAARQLLFGVPGRQRCSFEVFSDGLPIGRGEEAMDQLPYPDQLEGVEIYRGVTQIPSQYYRYGMCGVVLAWTRPGGEDGRPFTWGRALAGGIILLVILLIH
jgi:hypothetical protein